MPKMKTLTMGGETFYITDEKAVRFEQQSLTEEQKEQARKNIGAVTAKDVLNALPTWTGGSY